VRRISRSSVPCSSSIRSFRSLVDILGDDTEVPVECQGEQTPRWGTALHSKNALRGLRAGETGCKLSVVREVKKEIPACERSLPRGETIRRARTVTAALASEACQRREARPWKPELGISIRTIT
jgi:hypothetical protein